MEETKPEVDLARVNVNEHEALAERFGISHFPVFMLVRDAGFHPFPTLNNGGAIKARLAQELDVAPPSPYKSLEKLSNATEWLFWRGTDGGIMETAVVLDLREATSQQRRVMKAVALERVEDMRFGEIKDYSISSVFAFPKPPTIALYKDFDEGKDYFEGKWTKEAINRFINERRVPLSHLVTHWNLDKIRNLPRGVMVHLFIPGYMTENGTYHTPLRQEISRQAQEFEKEYGLRRGLFTVGVSDGDKYLSWKKEFGLEDDATPSVAVGNKVNEEKYGEPYDGDVSDYEALARFTLKTAKRAIFDAAAELGEEVQRQSSDEL